MKIFVLFFIIAFSSTAAWADVTLHYVLQDTNGEKTQIQISTHMIWAKISEPEDKNTSLLFKAGHLFPLFKLNHTEKTYQNLNPEVTEHLRLDENNKNAQSLFQYSEIKLEPTGKKQVISGIKCRIVHEIINGEPMIEHCLANSARAGLSERDVKTMIRTYHMLRKHLDSGWLGTGTVDEEYLSVRSRHLKSAETLLLREVSNKRLGFEDLRIPATYQLIKSAEN